MKYILGVVSTILVIACSVNKEAAKKEIIAFDFPENIKEAEKDSFVQQVTKGKKLYEITCAKCHNINVAGKMMIPDFSLPQLMDYEMRVQYPSHEKPLNAMNVSVDELDKIVDFLRYKKRSGVPFP